MIAVSELGAKLISMSDRGYNVIVGSTPANPILFHDYSDHPRRLIQIKPGLASTAAGRYQLLKRYYDAYKASLNLPDFSPGSQDAIAIQQIKECRALDDIESGHIAIAIGKCSHIWASFPGSPWGQHTNSLASLEDAFERAGGVFA